MDNIQYKYDLRSKVTDSFSEMLRESAQYFADKGITMTTGAGFEEILSEQSLFNEYKSMLTEGMEADQVQNFEQLLENSRRAMLQEASVSGIQQVAGLSMPTIRKMWAKVSLKHAIPTQAVAIPRFMISYTKAYLMDSEGNKHELPDAINALDNKRVEMPRISNEAMALPLDSVSLFDKVEEPYVASIEKHDTVDKLFYIEYVNVTAPKFTPEGEAEVTGDDVKLRIHLKTDQYANLYLPVHIPVQKKDPNTGVVTKYGEVVDTLIGHVDYNTGIFTCISTKGIITSVELDAKLSMETNESGESVSFDVLTKDITIPVGTHLNAPLPIEWLQDTMAIYNIDGAAEVIDLMSQTVAQKLEIEIYNFLKNSIEINNITYRGEFNMIPSAGFNGTPKMWREELKTVIDYFATKMRRDAKFHGGKFMIIGSPIDMAILPNVDWTFNHNSDQMSGVEVSFNLGAFSGQNRFEMVSSDLIPDGALIMFFIPATDRMMTYKYYPYTFNVERGYRDPNMPNVPSLMMTKRHTLEEFTPLICQITIKNNIGRLPETIGY